VVVDLPMPPLP